MRPERAPLWLQLDRVHAPLNHPIPQILLRVCQTSAWTSNAAPSFDVPEDAATPRSHSAVLPSAASHSKRSRPRTRLGAKRSDRGFVVRIVQSRVIVHLAIIFVNVCLVLHVNQRTPEYERILGLGQVGERVKGIGLELRLSPRRFVPDACENPLTSDHDLKGSHQLLLNSTVSVL